MKTETQKKAILNELLLGVRLTGLDILNLCGCIKASNRISELCDEGYNIQRKMIAIETPHGKKRVAQYWIEQNPKNPDFIESTPAFI